MILLKFVSLSKALSISELCGNSKQGASMFSLIVFLFHMRVLRGKKTIPSSPFLPYVNVSMMPGSSVMLLTYIFVDYLFVDYTPFILLLKHILALVLVGSHMWLLGIVLLPTILIHLFICGA